MRTRARSWSINTSMVPRRAGREAERGDHQGLEAERGLTSQLARPSLEEEGRKRLRAVMEKRAITTAKSDTAERTRAGK